MATSETLKLDMVQDTVYSLEKGAPVQNTSSRNSKSENLSAAEPRGKKKKDSQENEQSKDLPKDDKISGAEKKKKAKEEKAAKRAREKQEKQGQQQQISESSNTDIVKQAVKNETAQSGPDRPAGPKNREQPAGLTSFNTRKKPLAFRPPESVSTSIVPAHMKESKTVGLFGHLYGNPRRFTIAGAASDVHPAVLALGLQMSNYTICGSNARFIATLQAFKEVIQSYNTPQGNSLPRHLAIHLTSQIDYLASCRPHSVSMGNAIRWLKVVISAVDPDTSESKAKADLCDAIDNFVQEKIIVADQTIVASAIKSICDGDTILTYGKSSIVQQILIEAFRQGKKFKVMVVDSRPLFEGKNLARALGDLGLEVQYSLTQGINHAIRDVTKVFLGAHAMMSNGRLYSRVGTAIVAMTAKEASLPVIVCCESIKFTDRVALDSYGMNEVAPPDELILQGNKSTSLSKWRETPNLQLLNILYDLTPADYISILITEHGLLPPSSVPGVHRLSTSN